MEEQGIVGPADGARPREVLVSSMDEVFGSSDAPAAPVETEEEAYLNQYCDSKFWGCQKSVSAFKCRKIQTANGGNAVANALMAPGGKVQAGVLPPPEALDGNVGSFLVCQNKKGSRYAD
jgi:hypothetical protein